VLSLIRNGRFVTVAEFQAKKTIYTKGKV